MKKILLFLLLPLCSWQAYASASSGNCMPKAVSLGVGRNTSVTLVNEWDPDFGEYSDFGVYYYKVTLSKGQEFTIWITGGDAADMDLDVFTDFEDESAPWASFDVVDYDNGETKAATLYADSWMEDDPARGTFYICVSGEIGAKTTLSSRYGVQSFVKEGEEGNPKRLTFTTSTQTHASALIDGQYYYRAALEAGSKYRFLVRGSYELTVDGSDDFSVEDDPAYTNRTDLSVKLIYPAQSADYTICVSSSDANSSDAFSVSYYAYEKRSPADHDWQELTVADANSVLLKPGRVVADADKYYDAVIDESLCRLKVTAGDRWVFQTEGAHLPVEMRAYDRDGKILNVNTSTGNGSADCRTVFQAGYDGYYYVGVCDPSLDVMSVSTNAPVRVFAKNAADFNEPDDADSFDPADDTLAGASMLVAYPGAPARSVTHVGKAHGPHVLSGGDWYDWYCLPGRKGVTYAVRASFATTAVSDVALNGSVYKVVDGVRSAVADVRGSLQPAEASASTDPLTFTADADALYYVMVYAGTGGQDYPAYNMHAMCYALSSTGEASDVGLVRVHTKGAESTWAFSKNGFYYPNDAVVAVPANRDFTVGFTPVSGYSVFPGSLVTNAVPYVAGESEKITDVTAVYTDVYDHDDDDVSLKRFATIVPSYATAKERRTLWTDDPEDNFRFVATAGVYYNFALVDQTQDGVGDAVFSIASAMTLEAFKNPLISGQTSHMKKSFDAGSYMLKVSHADAARPKDTAYLLAYSCVNVGTVQFAAKSVSVSENAAYADVQITRTSDEGKVRLNWATEAYTAKPGKEYYPDNGRLVWEDGDKEPKTIRVRLIPDLKATWDETLYFAVNIWPLSEDSWEDDEYGAIIAGSSKIAVKLIESSEKAPGTIVVRRQPLMTVAGEALAVTLGREGGTDGDVGVVCATVGGTAVRGVDFTQVQTNVVWLAGDAADKVITIPTAARGSYDEKSLSLKLGSLATVYPEKYPEFSNPGLQETLVPAVIKSELIRKDLAAVNAAMPSVAMTSISGLWYGDAVNPLRSQVAPAGGKVAFKFYVTEPGFFVVHPQIENADEGSSFLYQCCGGEILDCSSNDRLVLAVPRAGNVAFVARSPGGTAHVIFSDVDGTGNPCKWIPLSSVQPTSPRDGAFVLPMPSSFSWAAPANKGGEEIWYRVKASPKSADACAFVDGLTVADTATTCAVPEIFKAGRTYWWKLEMACRGDGAEPMESDWISAPAAWRFTTVAENAPVTVPAALARDVNGTPIADLVAAGKPVELVQGARIDFLLDASAGAGDDLLASVVAGALPAGVKLAGTRLYGVPKESGDFSALVQVARGSLVGTTLALDFHVVPIGTAAGSFCGVLKEDGSSLAKKALRLSALSFSVTEAGALTGKAKINGVSVAFSSSGYEEVVDRDEGAPGKTMRLTTTMKASLSVDGAAYASSLFVSIGSGATTNLVALGETAGEARLTVDGRMVGSDSDTVDYTCELVRNNASSPAFVEALKPFAGYYTAALVPFGVTAADGLPAGHGVASITVGETGASKFALVLADRQNASSAAFVGLKGDLTNPAACTMLMPVIAAADTYSFGGMMEVTYATAAVEGVPFSASVVDSRTALEWNKDGADASYRGDSFSIEIRPTGGWYDTVANLQRYYLQSDFSLEYQGVDSLPTEMLPAGYAFTAHSTPHGVGIRLEGDGLVADSREFVKVGSYVDLENSVNPWSATVSLNRANGLVRGTATVVSDGAEAQTMAGTVNHYGILLMNRDSFSPLDTDVWTAGFYQFPASNEWKMSLPFTIKETRIDRDWSEVSIP